AELPHFRVYDLRHTFATHLLARGVPISYVSAQLGHADATTTLRWYARWLPSPQGSRRAVDVPGGETPAAPWHQCGANRDQIARRTRQGSTRKKWSRARDLNPRPADYESVRDPRWP
ncbi:MAG TPA: tyrosine-type recombinase/integrase, partial [Gemmatimonadaceae bacterium]|nr:tyrosine-type recombinase/integrase [Gemmatimonadaceae bacterium]